MAAFFIQRAAALVLVALPLAAQASLFADDEARQEIIKLRPQVDGLRRSLANLTEELRVSEEARRASQAQQQAAAQALAKSADEQAQLRRGLLELANQLEVLRRELTQLRGENEQMVHFVSGVQRGLQDMKRGQADLQMALDGMRGNMGEMQRSVNELGSGVEARIRRIEPVKVNIDGRDIEALPAEVSAFDAALAIMRKGEFAAARTAFEQFQLRYPNSGYRPSVLYWLGNAQYATRDYKDALGSLRRMLQVAPDHPRAAEAMLTIANCQIELKEPRATVRRTLEDLVKSYPQDEASAAAKERLSKLK